MLELSRTVRFCLSPDAGDAELPRDNTFSAWPPMRGLGRYYELHVTCRGEADPETGYFINIKHIDTAVRDHALPILRAAVDDEVRAAAMPMGALLRDLVAALQPALGYRVARLSLQLTPLIAFAMEPAAMDHVLIAQQYEFSAAHRLHVAALSDEENVATFGKCNNPAGHGHNYRVRVTVRGPVDPAGHTLDVATLDTAIDRLVIDKLDHKHLNEDVPAFAELNPSVENIVRVVWDMLAPKLASATSPGVSLDEVTVWETGKTSCTYRGPQTTSGR
ncbi:MAG: 6-carboxytetrahydropterin synthase [Planctomycetota bacterium]